MATVILVVISNSMDYCSVMLRSHVAIVSKLRDKTSQNSEKLRDITSQINKKSLTKKIECNVKRFYST